MKRPIPANGRVCRLNEHPRLAGLARAGLLIVVLFSFLTSALADNILLLTNPKSGETNVFRKGSYLVFELKADNSVREGFIRGITDSSLVFDYSQVSLSQINVLAGSTKSRIVAGKVANAVGTTLLVAGTTVFNCGTSIILNSEYYYWPLGGAVWAVGGCIAVVGHAFDWAIGPRDRGVRVRNYRQWNAGIVQDGQSLTTNNPNVQVPDPMQTSPAPVSPKKEKRKKSKITEDDVYGN